MPEQPQQKQGFWQRLGFFQKAVIVILLIVFGIIVFNFFTGAIKGVFDFFFAFLVVGVILLLLYFLVRTLLGAFKPKPFSARESFFVKIVGIARDMKPKNVRDLYFSGDVGRQRTLYGKIVGLCGIARLSGRVKVDSKGKTIYSKRKDPYNQNRYLPEFEKIDLSNEYDTFFIIKKGIIFPKFHYLRVPKELHSTLNGDVEVYDINPQPYGRWEYPFKVMQKEVRRITYQHQLEAILEVHEQQHDFAGVLVDSALGFNPNWQMIRRSGEQLPAVVTPNG